MNTCYVVQSSRPAGLFSFGLLDGLHVRLRRPYLREAPAGFGLERLATAFMNNPGEYELDALANKDFQYLTKKYFSRKLKEKDWLD